MLVITTCQTYPQPPQNLLPFARILAQRGIACRFDTWQNAPDAPFVLPLCAWDYAAAAAAFAGWINRAAARGQTFFNPPELMLWNMDKRYLTDLAARGVNVIPSVWLPSENGLHDLMQRQNWSEAVIKPAVGQSGKGVCKIRSGETWRADYRFSDGLIVQPYIREIEQAGETSLVFFDGVFSHAVCRKPPQGEWRANSAYGVTVLPAEPPDSVIRAAESVLQTLPQRPAYARVDGTVSGGTFLLNELELIEPALYLHTVEGAAGRFAEIIAAQIRP